MRGNTEMARGSAIFFEGRKGDYIMGGATEFANFMNPADTVGYFLTKHLEKCMYIRDFQLLIENMNKIYFLKNAIQCFYIIQGDYIAVLTNVQIVLLQQKLIV